MFLRKIEYFQGVLFLTTNRKDDFDDAFKSRINLTITFPELSNSSRSAIWRGLIAANGTVKLDDSWTDEIYSALGQLCFNVSDNPSTPQQCLLTCVFRVE